MLSFCMGSFILWVISSEKERFFISIIGIVVIFLLACLVVEQRSNDIVVWFVTKLVFVVYFGIFIGRTLSGSGKKKVNHTVKLSILIVLMAVCFAVKYAGMKDALELFSLFKPLHANNGIYGWPDFIEDILFGLAGALAAELTQTASESDDAPSTTST